MNALTLEELRNLSELALVRLYDEQAQKTIVGLQFIRDELHRREQDKQTKQMLKLTKWITFMTLVMTVATIINVIIACLTLRR